MPVDTATVPDAPIPDQRPHLSDPAYAQAPHDPSDACVVQEVAGVKCSTTIECAGGCGAGVVGCDPESAMLAADWIQVGGAWLCWECAADPSIVTEVSAAGDK